MNCGVGRCTFPCSGSIFRVLEMKTDRGIWRVLQLLNLFVLKVVGENDTDTSCNQSECLRCNLDSNECVKCYHVMMVAPRSCLHRCPRGFDPIWAEDREVFGWICQERSVFAMVSYRQVGIIAGVSVLGAICIGVFLGVLLLHKKGIKVPPDSPQRGLPRILQDKRPKTAEISIKGKERAEFLERLRTLRKDAPFILRMMASTRNRFRSGPTLGREALSDAKTKACKAVVRDLSRVLCLLSVKEEYLHTAPKDWKALLAWAERLLARYKRQEELKGDKEDKGGYSALSTEGPSNESRTHFVTRKEQMKAEKDRRRSQGDSPQLKVSSAGSPKHEEDADTKDYCSKIPNTSSNNNNNNNNNHVDIEKGISESCSHATSRGSKQEDQSSDDELADLQHKIKSIYSAQKGKDSTKDPKDDTKYNTMLNLHKFLVSRLPFLKRIDTGFEDKDLDSSLHADLNISKDLDVFDVDQDDIPSQTFFDHIEAFAFDFQTESPPTKPLKPDLIISAEDDFENEDNSKNSNKFLSNNSSRKNIIIQKNFKNSSLSLNNSFDQKFASQAILKSDIRNFKPPKEKRSSKLRRLSSSILMKDKPHLSLKRERRPLKRQKRVDKLKHSKILQKYQCKRMNENETNSSGGQCCSEESTSHESPKAEAYSSNASKDQGTCDRVSTIIPVGSFRSPSEQKPQIQHFEHSKIKIFLGGSLCIEPENLDAKVSQEGKSRSFMTPQTSSEILING